ncbi:Non-specific serine/threonine protein kinase protein [Dioscorea alata]|uniref:Non-specific serine/threonine protein kinase protein n=1 Tax=Dioscorea alata TaxID=55571 RepID=A0ACB7UEK5_DIOAL|nr:Non-specific serine/threonine protein kinase protein [Dioscorea alata]
MASSRDVQDVISKLSSDKAKTRDEGVRLLSSWLEGERLIGFCKLLGRNTAKIKADEMLHAETWPFLLTLLMKCIKLEISSSKKKQPKLLYAKTLRIAIQCAEDPKLSGKRLSIFHVAKVLFSHILEVLKDAPIFQMEYNIILRHLLAVNEYRYQMRKRVYCSLVNLYMNKVVSSIGVKLTAQSGSKEESFRCVLMLHVLLDNPPGDFPDNIRDDLIDGFIGIFAHVRDEGKISRKLMDCVNTYLLKDGPNLGCRAKDIHAALQGFLCSFWLTTHDRGLKNSFILYARIQLKLGRSILDETELIGQLLDVISKELDHSSSISSGAIPWTDTSKDEKIGNLGSQQGLIELAATVFYQACMGFTRISCQGKRLKMVDVATRLKDGLMKGSGVWTAAFYFLIHSYGLRLDKSLLIDWFQGACEVLQRTFQELLFVLCPSSDEQLPQHQCFTSGETVKIRNAWHVIWSCLMHGLPMFSKVASVADAALTLLGNMTLTEQIGAAVVPQDVWNLRIFNNVPSLSALYFVACYFSKTGVQGDLQNVIYLRKSLLQAILDLVNFKEPANLNEQSVLLIPASLFSLCAGCAPFLICIRRMSIFLGTADKWSKMEGVNERLLDEILECSTKALAEIKSETTIQVQSEHHHTVRLPRQISQPLVSEMEEFILGLIVSNGDIERIGLSSLMHICSFFCNCIYGSFSTSIKGDNNLFISKVSQYIIKLLDHMTSIIEKYNEIHCNSCLGLSSILDAVGLSLSSLQGFLSSPLFPHCRDKNYKLLGGLLQTIEKLLLALAKLFPDLSRIDMTDLSLCTLPSPENRYPVGEPSAQIIDMELDVTDDSKDVEALAVRSSDTSVISLSPQQLRIEIVKACSYFFPVLPIFTWEVLLDLMRKENDAEVLQPILFNLCKHFPQSTGSLPKLVIVINKMMDTSSCLSCHYASMLSSSYALLESYLPSSSHDKQCGEEVVNNVEYFKPLGCLMNKIAELDLPDWSNRIEIINCLCSFILLEPCLAQVVVERLLSMLQDGDYRVRFFLARKIQVLFQTWDGHDALFHDICSNFGFEMLRASKEKLVKSGGEVLVAGNLPLPARETALITLAHVALSSEDVEIEAVFIICVVAAVHSYHRKLAYALIDNLSRQLQYASRTKYLEELIGPIIFRWVACEMSLMALVEIRDLFMTNSEAKYFMRSCCPWLLPALILRGKIAELDLVAKVTCQPLIFLVKEYFVPIFAICIALHSSERPEKEMAGIALCNSILQIGKLSELERDDLIKKHMVSTVSFLLSLASSSVDPPMPLFSNKIIAISVKMVVDGFLEKDDHNTKEGIVDKINIFRPDRVFKFLVEIHNQISSAVHPRHKQRKLSAIEVLIDVIGYRAAISSTSVYIFSIVGHFIRNQSLENQCCGIISTLLDTYRINPTKEAFNVLGEQLQFLVSKLVACCIPSEAQAAYVCSPNVISLLHQLTVDADPSLYDYIRELELFPQLDSFARIRTFHEKLCEAYSPREHFLKFIRRCSYLPQGLLLWSLRNLHKKLLMGEIIQLESNGKLKLHNCNRWNADPEVVSAVWSLVRLCGSNGMNDMCALLADFISRVGIGDPYDVIFHLPWRSQSAASNPSILP